MPRPPVLGLDLGGTKLAAALVGESGALLDRRQAPTDRHGGPEAWIDDIARLIEGWSGYAAAGIAVTGLVRCGRWRALNPDTLPVPENYDLEGTLRARLGVPVLARNDAQAAAWGEFRHGAGQGADMAFVTVSTGVGGGLVMGGRLVEGRGGLAGHLGIAPLDTPGGERRLEDMASGAALDRLARARAPVADGAFGPAGAPAVAAAAGRREPWAEALMDAVLAPLALALRRLQLVLDPDLVVVGGGLGLAPGYLDRLRRHLEPCPAPLRPELRAAALGADAGLIGVADLARALPRPRVSVHW